MVKTLKDFSHWTEMKNQIIQADCLKGMKMIPDKSIDLVLTDPPYGIGASTKEFVSGNRKHNRDNECRDWDNAIPTKECFLEIQRISKNQIIWGGNYFIEYLTSSRCFLVWDKTIHGNSYADCEMAWTSYDSNARIKALNMVWTNKDGRVHPTQKPVELMRWILENYSKEGDLICDPFMGSWTTARACKDLGRDFVGFELDEEYCKVGEKRLQQEILF